MPYSDQSFDRTIVDIVSLLKPKIVLDVGAGAGKYGRIIRSICPDVHISAIEVEEDYIHRFNLHGIYDEIVCGEIQKLLSPQYVEAEYDLAILGDVIEHLKKSEGIDVLNFLMYRTRWLLVVYPVQYLQNSVDGYLHEAHISVWGETDFVGFETSHIARRGNIEMLCIKGFLQHDVEIGAVNKLLS
jgi:trans-aconitate methyltransferase